MTVLGGTALRVYLYLLRRGRPVTPRELQEALGFRSVSTAYHHLERLERLGLVERRGEGYAARRPRGLLGLYVAVRGRLVPLSVVAAGASTGATVGYVLAGRDPLAAILLAFTTILLWLDAVLLARAAGGLGEG